MDELSEYYTKKNKPAIKRQILHDSTSMKYLEYSKSQRKTVNWWLSWARGRGKWELLPNGYNFSFTR